MQYVNRTCKLSSSSLLANRIWNCLHLYLYIDVYNMFMYGLYPHYMFIYRTFLFDGSDISNHTSVLPNVHTYRSFLLKRTLIIIHRSVLPNGTLGATLYMHTYRSFMLNGTLIIVHRLVLPNRTMGYIFIHKPL